jgi:hypothetical protein
MGSEFVPALRPFHYGAIDDPRLGKAVSFSDGLGNGDWLGLYSDRACPRFPGKVGGASADGRMNGSAGRACPRFPGKVGGASADGRMNGSAGCVCPRFPGKVGRLSGTGTSRVHSEPVPDDRPKVEKETALPGQADHEPD